MFLVKNNLNFPLTLDWQLLFSATVKTNITIQNDDDEAIIYLATKDDDDYIIKILYPLDVWKEKIKRGYSLYIKSSKANAKFQAMFYA